MSRQMTPIEHQTQRLRALYHACLATPLPVHSKKGHRAGGKTRRHLLEGVQDFARTKQDWDQIAQWAETQADRIWLWSDWHLGHANVIRYSGRPFHDVNQMNEALLDAALRVPADDWMLCLGDVSMGVLEDANLWCQLVPARKALVWGNHDVDRQGKPAVMRARFQAQADCVVLPALSGSPYDYLWLTHYPLDEKDIPDGVLNIHGHIHQHTLSAKHRNVSVECVDYQPIQLSQLLLSV